MPVNRITTCSGLALAAAAFGLTSVTALQTAQAEHGGAHSARGASVVAVETGKLHCRVDHRARLVRLTNRTGQTLPGPVNIDVLY